MKQRSLFDVISPIMTGPSSSHTAGAVRLGLLARNIYEDIPEKITFKLLENAWLFGKLLYFSFVVYVNYGKIFKRMGKNTSI